MKGVTPREVEQTLRELAQSNSLNINRLRVIVALERFVCRLESQPELGSHLIFKGGFALLKTIASARFTRDVDALARHISKEKVPDYVEMALKIDLHDGFWFGDLRIKEQMFAKDYGGLRFDCAFRIGNAARTENELTKLARIHLDVGFGDKIPEHLRRQEMPTMFKIGKPVSWLVYPLESILAEKLETLCRRADANSRAKDIFDLVELFRLCQDQEALMQSITMTFETRKTPIPSSFFRFASNLEEGIFRTAWKSIIVSGNKPTFEESWKALLSLCAGWIIDLNNFA
jgi:predicted nucleotidyltransferase component of viral defense system